MTHYNNFKDQPVYEEMTLLKMLDALSDEVRLEIVLKLAVNGEVSRKSFGFTMHKSSLSHHVKVLKEARMITSRRVGKDWVYSLRTEDVEAQFPGVLKAVVVSSLRDKTYVV
jgi:DNA-binding transcriptional ArsR family regulator